MNLAVLTQDDTAREMAMVRATVAQIELGNRSVSGLELSRLAYLYARDIREFVSESFDENSLASVLLRAEDDAGDGVRTALRDCIALGHRLRDLEALLSISRSTASVAAYPSVTLNSKWDAIQSGTQAAQEERRRLGLGCSTSFGYAFAPGGSRYPNGIDRDAIWHLRLDDQSSGRGPVPSGQS